MRTDEKVHLSTQNAKPQVPQRLQMRMGSGKFGSPGIGKSGWLFALTHWNWKVAMMTAVLRGSACVLALRHMEHHARNHFGGVEAVYVLFTCGFFSALQQQSLGIRTERLAWFSCVFVIPLTSLSCDASLHFWLDGRDTRQLGVPGLIFTVVSATFHWHMIRNGALLVGDESHTFVTDLKRIPMLLISYFTTMGAALWRLANTRAAKGEASLAIGAGD